MPKKNVGNFGLFETKEEVVCGFQKLFSTDSFVVVAIYCIKRLRNFFIRDIVAQYIEIQFVFLQLNEAILVASAKSN